MALDTLITGSNLDAGGNIKTALTNTPAYIGAEKGWKVLRALENLEGIMKRKES